MPRPSTAPKVACDQRSKALRRCEHDARYVGEHATDVARVVWPWKPEWRGTRRSLVEQRLLQMPGARGFLVEEFRFWAPFVFKV
ncbi:hypothetical protein CXB51_032775 [Gossypium anomalum]|uniref:Uncharacterized protein n=1 Tax=Gossypium anomalum TaxID=47600 RepID=A0A8J6CQ35_9ROSI|nr:hypothetical protein CXB51_032775 [Gossypium anomalum]